MPYYLFENINTQEVHEVFFHMNDNKIYNGLDGKEADLWRRIYTVPKMAISSIINPYDEKSFIAAVENKKGQTMGQVWERSAEASAQRADREGKDPIKEKIYHDYHKRTGLKHPNKAQEDTAIKAKEITKNFLKT